MSAMLDFLNAKALGLAQAAAEARRLKALWSWTQPGPKNRMRGAGRYTGEFLRRLRAERGVGRLVVTIVDNVVIPVGDDGLQPTYASAVKFHGSQRKAAAALGISLGKLQRELRKTGVL